jgi:bifunctional polynucleotide phosphatase/kinase
MLEDVEKSIVGWEWKVEGGLLYGSNGAPKSFTTKIALLDMDGCLITNKSKKKNPENAKDWVWFDKKEVPKTLKKYHDNGYRLVIATNQKGISLGHVNKKEICAKIEDLADTLNLPMSALVATDDDFFRKPLPGMWNFLAEKFSNGQEVSKSDSFFVGDAAGRPKTRTSQKDWNDTDLKFAANAGLKFYTPEEFFYGWDQKDLVVNLENCERNPAYELLAAQNSDPNLFLDQPKTPNFTKGNIFFPTKPNY